MGRYALRRLLQLIPVLFGTTFLIYWLVWSLPGNAFAGKCGPRLCEQSYIDEMRDRYNLDDPLIVQYFKYMWDMVRFDFGTTYSGEQVSEVLSTALPITMKLALVAVLIEGVIGITAGVLTGLKRGGFLDNMVLVSTLFLISLPVFVVGFLLQYLFGVKWGIIDPSVSEDPSFSELIIPGLVLASGQMAYISRLTRSSIAENNRADYVRTAVAKGLTRGRVVSVHLLRNSLIPIITFLGAEIGTFMGGAIVTEGIFNIQGVGGVVFDAVRGQEAGTVVPIVTVIVLIYLLANLIVDLLYAVLDPRIRYE
ncbi:MAG: ABC transporter permease [Corynebacteriales bacterium]|nr:ABC transporter permease [Mycobacteriales bacterium]